MKRGLSFTKSVLKKAVKWLLFLLIALTIMIILLFAVSLIQKRFRFDESIIRIILMICISLSAFICAFLIRKFDDHKGYICGLITALLFSVLKLTTSLMSGGVGNMNFLIYPCIICSSLFGGILSANDKPKKKW